MTNTQTTVTSTVAYIVTLDETTLKATCSTNPVGLLVPCDACGAEAGEECRPLCIGEAAHQDETVA